jgi:hypothetical protein
MMENMKEYAEAYGLKYQSYTDFEWVQYYPNNMVQNGLEGYDCLIVPKAGFCRKYSIRFQFETDVTALVLNSEEPRLFILFENDSFVYACPTLDFAKQRAYTQYAHIHGYVMSHIEAKEVERAKISGEDLVGHWTNGTRGSWQTELVLLPDGTGIGDFCFDSVNDLSWRLEDDVLILGGEGGLFLPYCGIVTFNGAAEMTVNGRVFTRQASDGDALRETVKKLQSSHSYQWQAYI